MSGKTHNDEFYVDENGRTRTRTNRSGGVQGGISNGETIVVRVVRERERARVVGQRFAGSVIVTRVLVLMYFVFMSCLFSA